MGQAPPQPQALQYGLDQLYLYPRYTRASYFAAFGADAPAFRQAEPIKRWALPPSETLGHAPPELFTYRYVDADGKIKTNSIPFPVAGQLNLPGLASYPKYSVQPTQATAGYGPGQSGPINPEYLSNRVDADALARQLGAASPVEPELPFGGISYPSGETRRAWQITLQSGVAANVGMLLKEKYKLGVGAPGHWSDLKNPQWIAEAQATVEANLLPEVPIPARDLLPDESIAQVFMGGWVIQRTQLSQKLSDTDLMAGRVREIWQATVGQQQLGQLLAR